MFTIFRNNNIRVHEDVILRPDEILIATMTGKAIEKSIEANEILDSYDSDSILGNNIYTRFLTSLNKLKR